MSHAYEVRLEPLPDIADLRRTWSELEHRAACSYFQSWAWIGAWLELICDLRQARLVSVYRNARLLALGVVTEKRRLFGFGPLHLRLHETGDLALDNLTIEYNGLLTVAGHEKAALAAVVRHLARNDSRWLTLHLPGVDIDGVDFESLQHDALDLRMNLRAMHFVDLKRLRQADGDYLAALPAKLRGNIHRTERKLVDAHGGIVIETTSSPAQRREFFDELVRLHQACWTARGSDGAFADPRILRFHERLIDASTAVEGPQFTRMRAGGKTIGCLYCILWRGHNYYYQAGIDYAGYARFGSPGLLLLAHSVQAAADMGLERYEFMAGNAPYKRKLGNGEGRMAWVWIDRIGRMSRARQAWWSLRRSGHH